MSMNSDLINFTLSKNIEMEKMEDFFKDDLNMNKNLDSFFAKQTKNFHMQPTNAAIKLIIICLVLLGALFSFATFYEEESASSSISSESYWILWGIYFTFLIAVLFIFSYRLYVNSTYKYSYTKAKKKFQQLYPDYTDSILKHEIVKNDKEKIAIQTLYGPAYQYHIWLCNDFLLFCATSNYKFTFMKYSDILHIEYYKVHGHGSTGSPASKAAGRLIDMHDCVTIHYQKHNQRKELVFVTISPFFYSQAFVMKGINVIEHKDIS